MFKCVQKIAVLKHKNSALKYIEEHTYKLSGVFGFVPFAKIIEWSAEPFLFFHTPEDVRNIRQPDFSSLSQMPFFLLFLYNNR